MTLKYLSSTFGMFEMEEAAEQIVEKAFCRCSWNISVNYDELRNKAGFLQLIAYGWLVPFVWSKTEFVITQTFIDRITPKYKGLVSEFTQLNDDQIQQRLGFKEI